MTSDPSWFKDAVIYELHVKTFQDSNGDGIGDFQGLLQRLDYFVELGITAIWLLPFYPSPLKDDGYDIADYYSVNPSYGTVEDFQAVLEAAHSRGLRVITELVLNHTSDQNPWFQRSRRARPGSPERDFYVWSDDPRRYAEARIIFKDFETSNWTWDPVAKAYFWHRFYSHQPDLNFDNPVVHDELLKVIDFWLAMGVDGVRLDAVPYLYEREGTNCENLEETHAFLRKLRAHIDSKFPNRMLLAEANQWPEDSAAYFGKGDECHMEFHFPLMPRLFMSLQMEDRFPIIDILDQTPEIPDTCQWAIFLRNHDELTLEMVTDAERDYMYRVYAQDPRARINLGIRRRLGPLLGNNRRKIELINSLLFSLPGTPIIYYGDEIGMGDNFYLGDRNGVRTPMQWSPDRNAGFSTANPQQLFLPVIIDPEYHYEAINVENQQRNVSSLFWWMRRLLAVRRRSRAFARGTIEFLHPGNAKVLAYLRSHEGETILAIANLSRFSQVVELDLSEFAGWIPEEMFGRIKFPEIRQAPVMFTLGPHGFYWFLLKPTATTAALQRNWTMPAVEVAAQWAPALRDALATQVLPAYLPVCSWFRTMGREVREVKVMQVLDFGKASDVQLVAVEAIFNEGLPETYLLPLTFAEGSEVERLIAEAPQAVLARLQGGVVLYDAFWQPAFREMLLRWVLERRSHRFGDARIIGEAARDYDEETITKALANVRFVGGEEGNTSLAYGDAWVIKFYRGFHRGTHPEVRIEEALSSTVGGDLLPRHAGALKISDRTGTGVIAHLTEFIQNEGGVWRYTLDALGRYFERAIAGRSSDGRLELSHVIGGVYPERAELVGRRLAALHRALASVDDPDFVPEPYGTLHQRSLYQALRGAAGRVLRDLKQQVPNLPEELRIQAGLLANSQDTVYERFSRMLNGRLDGMRIRVHGDLHLGQILNTGKDFSFVDFEGDPRHLLGDRNHKRSPLVDVAGILRSVDYARSIALQRQSPEDQPALASWTIEWRDQICAHFLAGYLDAMKDSPLLPNSLQSIATMLGIFLLDKSLYEVGYELSERRQYAHIPIAATIELLRPHGSVVELWMSKAALVLDGMNAPVEVEEGDVVGAT